MALRLCCIISAAHAQTPAVLVQEPLQGASSFYLLAGAPRTKYYHNIDTLARPVRGLWRSDGLNVPVCGGDVQAQHQKNIIVLAARTKIDHIRALCGLSIGMVEATKQRRDSAKWRSALAPLIPLEHLASDRIAMPYTCRYMSALG
jgi:hypothetical protein